jgi:Ala-tRNA(Pro) deacylase
MTHLTEDTLLARLADLGIAVTLYRHPPVFTVEESQSLRGEQPGAHCKNMFLKAKSGDLVLVTCREDRMMRIRDLEKEIGLRKLSFGKPDLLNEVLGVQPGSVTPMALFNDHAHRLRFVLDAQMMQEDVLNCHPLHNAATIAISTADVLRCAEASGHTPMLVDFDSLEEKARQAAA